MAFRCDTKLPFNEVRSEYEANEKETQNFIALFFCVHSTHRTSCIV